MISASKPANEKERQATLDSYGILDSPNSPLLDSITRLAAQICCTPIALVSLIDNNRQFFKSKVGLEATETPRDVAFCAHAIHTPGLFMVEDSHKDRRFADNPLVTDGPKVRFYAGVPLVASNGHRVGTLCVIDQNARQLSALQMDTLMVLAKSVMAEIEKTHAMRLLAEQGDPKASG